MDRQADTAKPLVIVTGGAGGIGTALIRALQNDYTLISLDRNESENAHFSYKFDLTSVDSVNEAIGRIVEEHGEKVAAVVHLAAYFDFTGEPSPLYEKVNVQGTRNLLQALRAVEVERFIYSSTMLVHQPGTPGEKITEQTPLGPSWPYPQSKVRAEDVIREHAGDMPYTLLRLAGLYDEEHCVPTLGHQIARIYETTLKSHLYSGNIEAGQAFVHSEDMLDAFRRTIDRRAALPQDNVMLVGEPESVSYEALQDRLGELIHGAAHWRTLRVPKPIAKTGAWIEEKAEPIIPDDFDHGEKPFIRPFMVDMASDHYELDITRAQQLLDWQPKHRLYDVLPAMVENLKRDPLDWYQTNSITPPDWVQTADDKSRNPDQLLARHKKQYRQQHAQNLWARFANVGLGAWLVTSPPILGYADSTLAYSDIAAGLALLVFGLASLSWRHSWARWASGAVGLWLLLAPLVLWADTAAGYLNSTLCGMLAIGFGCVVGPAPGISPVAALTGPDTPPGWDNNPSSWLQRMPIIALALVGLIISRYLAAYQLGHIDAVWDPFFAGSGAPDKNGTEAVITSEVSAAWPIPDAGLGGVVYALEILLGLIGGANRWRTMPWVVAAFGVLIVPLGVVSITFIIIQPIVIGTWCALCLVAAAAMLLQIAYAANELVATGEFLRRRYRKGAPVLKIFFIGDTDDGPQDPVRDEFQADAGQVLRQSVATGVSLPWTLALAGVVGAVLMFSRVLFGAEGAAAHWNHLLGALIITASVIAMAEVARPVRWLLIPLALPLLVIPFVLGAGTLATMGSLVCAAVVIALSPVRGPVRGRYGNWSRKLA